MSHGLASGEPIATAHAARIAATRAAGHRIVALADVHGPMPG